MPPSLEEHAFVQSRERLEDLAEFGEILISQVTDNYFMAEQLRADRLFPFFLL